MLLNKSILNKSISFILFILSFSLFSNISHSSYSFAGIVPIAKDQNNDKWLYFGVEYKIKTPMLAIIGGQREENESPQMTAIRELNEETLDVFNKYITLDTLKDTNGNHIKEMDYNILFLISTKIFWVPINYTVVSGQAACEDLIFEYEKHRFEKPEHYKSLKLNQKETYEIRRVRLKDLIKFLKDPYKYDEHIMSYGLKDCSAPVRMKLRWSSKILLQSQPDLNNFLK